MATILVVDDDGLLCGLLHDVLSEEGYEVRCAHHGVAALEEIGRSLPDLVLTDVQMPYLDGIGLLGCLEERSLNVPVVLMSAMRPRVVPVGVAFVAKPFDLDDLLVTVEGALSVTNAAA
ncbi:MAG: response regulator [Chloroflexota bacterium]|nr:response regulator [Chloroflexota bacterium]